MRSFFISSLLLSLSIITNAQSVFWEISGNGLKKNSYLFGTIHIQDKRVFDLNKSVYKKLKSCNTFAMELTPDAKSLAAITKGMMLKDGQTLKDLYSEEDYQLIADTLKKYTGMPIAMFNTMHPVVLSTMLMDVKLNKDMKEPLDLHFYKYAKEKGLETVALETVDEQLNALDAMTPEYALDAFKSLSKYDTIFNQMIELYLTADLDKLHQMMVEDEASGFNTDELLDKRNVTMVDRIDEIAKKGSVFAAVGAGHLPGEQGVIELLRKKGYTVQPLKTK